MCARGEDAGEVLGHALCGDLVVSLPLFRIPHVFAKAGVGAETKGSFCMPLFANIVTSPDILRSVS